MKVSSPVGEFPFEPTSLTVEKGALVLKGSMGAWPARVEMEPRDLLTFVRLTPWAIVSGALLTFLVLSRRGTRR
jgi:hypothetical protein